MSLKQKTIKGLFWSFISQGGRQVSQLIVTVILARLLNPHDFGLLAMATVFINFAMIFSELGISSALIQKQDTHDRHYYSAFWLNVIVGSILTILFIALAPFIAGFYKSPELSPILMALSINFLLSSFIIIQQTILTKEMDFKKLAVRDIFSVIIAGMIGIIFAYNGFGVWSLVFQRFSFTLSSVLLLWTVSPWRPKFAFAKSDIKDILHFSANLTGFNIVNYFARNIDQLLIGKFLGAQALGYYSLAYKIMLYPIQNISAVINKVMFPAFSKIQNDIEKIRNSYIKMVKAISIITFPMTLVLFVVTPEFVRVVLGSEWEAATSLIMILCFCSLVQSVGGPIVGNIRLSQGRTDMHLQIGVTNSIMILGVVLFGIKWGVIGVAISYTVFSLFWAVLTNMVTLPLIKLRLSIFLSSLKSPLIVGLSTASIVYLVKIACYMSKVSEIIALFFSLSVGLGVYIFILGRFKLVSLRKRRLMFIE